MEAFLFVSTNVYIWNFRIWVKWREGHKKGSKLEGRRRDPAGLQAPKWREASIPGDALYFFLHPHTAQAEERHDQADDLLYIKG